MSCTLPRCGVWALVSLVLPSLGLRCGRRDHCPPGMVLLQGGSVRLGVDAPGQAYERPAFSGWLEPFCMDVYEYPNQAGVSPMADVTWLQAWDLCGQQGKRLCSADEWEHACRGGDGRRYSYGEPYDAQACNTPWDRFQGGAPPIAPSGSHPRCVSPQGVADLNGNLSEWVEDQWDGEKPRFEEEVFPAGTTYRTVRGGTMWGGTFYGQDCLSAHGHPETVTHMDDGFRCCAEAD